MPDFRLTIQNPKPQVVGDGVLSIGKAGDAEFFSGNGEILDPILATMVRTRIEWAAAAGILLSGMQPNGFDRHGKPKFTYQEWLLRPLTRIARSPAS